MLPLLFLTLEYLNQFHLCKIKIGLWYKCNKKAYVYKLLNTKQVFQDIIKALAWLI